VYVIDRHNSIRRTSRRFAPANIAMSALVELTEELPCVIILK